jgi:membrane protein implicated in regulation of membrane protease activity
MNFDLQAALWGLVALIALIVEVTHRTLYLVIVCVACGLASLSVFFFHATLGVQFTVIIVTSLAGIPIVGKLRDRSRSLHFPADRGKTVKVIALRDGRLRVMYRGAEWDAVYAGPDPAPGECLKIDDLEGSTLKLTSL